ncbi:Toxin-antitoxin biofilm protein TabA [compost metagenome]
MIVGSLQSLSYTSSHAVISKALQELIKILEGSDLPVGRIEIQGDQLYVNIMAYQTKSFEEQVAEKHEEYIDIHYVIEGYETIGWSPMRADLIPTQPYDQDSDFALYEPQPDELMIQMKPGLFAVFFPDDIHRPGMGDMTDVKKAVIKIHKGLLS